MKRISIIVPNYNAGKYLEECVNSVLEQDYPNKQIIIVDDGSSDESLEIIAKVMNDRIRDDITLVRQNNLNAAIARNAGMQLADGDYIMFLDSDDVLEEGMLKCLVSEKERLNTDLVVGNYTLIDEANTYIDKKEFTDRDRVINAKKQFRQLIRISPVPANKLYDLRIIKDNDISWGNVRIGQDLDFYLKYLLHCSNVALLNKNVFKYRICQNSMSRTYNYKIFDIVNVFKDLESYYNRHDQKRLYDLYLPALALEHYEMQMSKQKFFEKREMRDLVVRFFAVNEKELRYSLHDYQNRKFKKRLRRFRLKCFLRPLFISELYCSYKNRRKKIG